MKQPKPNPERRRSARIQEAVVFQIGHHDYDTEALSINISRHGALCLVEKDIPVMTQLDIAFCLNKKQVKVKGVVVRKDKDDNTGKFSIAIYFSEIGKSAQKTLDSFFDQRLVSDGPAK
jgi:c-di-GMP-binding flagellar brake protein YcgR